MDYRSEPATKQGLTAQVAEVAAPTWLTTGQHDAAGSANVEGLLAGGDVLGQGGCGQCGCEGCAHDQPRPYHGLYIICFIRYVSIPRQSRRSEERRVGKE